MAVRFGLAIENFTSAEKAPTWRDLVDYATRAEELGFTSLWAWDHLFLGSKQPFPQLEALTTLAVLAAHTETVTLGTGILVLPLRDPALLAKTAATLQDLLRRPALPSGWRQAGTSASSTPPAAVKGRGRVFEHNLEICMRLWTRTRSPASGATSFLPPRRDAAASRSRARGPHRRLRRPGAAPGRHAG